MALRSVPFELSSVCGKHHVTLKRWIQRPSRKSGSSNKADDFWIAVLRGVYEKEAVVVKVYGGLKEHLGEAAYNRARREVEALKKLSKSSKSSWWSAASPHAPHFRASFDCDGNEWWYSSSGCADCHVIVMTKVPGKHVGKDILEDPYKYRRVRGAFEEALDDIHSRGVDNDSHVPRNFLWDEDENKCYIVDYERALFKGHWKESCFADWVDAKAPPYPGPDLEDVEKSPMLAEPVCGGFEDAVRECQSARNAIEESSTASESTWEGVEASCRGSEAASETIEEPSRAAKIEELQVQMAAEEGHVAQG